MACALSFGSARGAHGSPLPTISEGGGLNKWETSGANFHPGVTLALSLRRHISPARGGMYVLAQLCGAIGGAALAQFIVTDGCFDGVLVGHPQRVPLPSAIAMEALFNTTLCLLYLWTDRRNSLMAYRNFVTL